MGALAEGWKFGLALYARFRARAATHGAGKAAVEPAP
jgi:hypothetical protein